MTPNTVHDCHSRGISDYDRTGKANAVGSLLSSALVFLLSLGTCQAQEAAAVATSDTAKTLAPPSAPVLTAPINGASGVSLIPILTWAVAAGASSYDVYFGVAPAPSFTTNTTAASYQPTGVRCRTRYYWRVVAKNGGGASTSLTGSFTTMAAAIVPVVVFRDTAGSIRLSSYPASTISNSGGAFASDPSAAQDPSGNTFVTARDKNNSIWVNIYNPNNSTWSGWQFGGGIIQGVPSIAVDASETGWIASRDTYNSYWLVSYREGNFGTWKSLLGTFSTDPVVTACGDGSIYLIGKDTYNSLWSGHYIPGKGFQGWQFGGGIVKGKPAATCGGDNAVYVVAEGESKSNWMARVAGDTWTGWFPGALTSAAPQIAALGDGSEAVVVQDSTNVVWRATYTEGAANGWQPPAEVGGILQNLAPAGVRGQLYVAGKSPNGELWWWQQNGSQWTRIGNNGVAAGMLSAAPR